MGTAPTNDEQLSFRIPVELSEVLTETSAAYGRSVAEELRLAVKIYIRQHALWLLQHNPEVRRQEAAHLKEREREIEQSLNGLCRHAFTRPSLGDFLKTDEPDGGGESKR
jgi:predicted DNA-binding protein